MGLIACDAGVGRKGQPCRWDGRILAEVDPGAFLPYAFGKMDAFEVVAEGTGVLLNNELDDFTAAPGASNAFGLVVIGRVVWNLRTGVAPEAVTMGAVGFMALAVNGGVAPLIELTGGFLGELSAEGLAASRTSTYSASTKPSSTKSTHSKPRRRSPSIPTSPRTTSRNSSSG